MYSLYDMNRDEFIYAGNETPRTVAELDEKELASLAYLLVCVNEKMVIPHDKQPPEVGLVREVFSSLVVGVVGIDIDYLDNILVVINGDFVNSCPLSNVLDKLEVKG
jgi:hypothetical protein